MSEVTASREAEPIFLGLLEGLCFLCLFLSPLLAGFGSDRIWNAVALLRVIVFAVAILPRRGPFTTAPSMREVTLFLGRSMLYQLPFWASALFFPLRQGQGRLAVLALALQLALMAMLVPLANLAGRVGAESLVFLLTLGWILGERPPGPWLVVAAMAWVLTLRGVWRRAAPGWQMTCWQGLAMGVSWLVVFVLPTLSADGSGVGPMTFFWVLVLFLNAVAFGVQLESAGNEETELGVPNPRRARVWLVGRRGGVDVLGWVALLALVVQSPQEAVACVVLFTVWWRGLELAAHRWLTPNRTIWWTASEITLVWASLQGGGVGSALTLFLAVLLLVGLRLIGDHRYTSLEGGPTPLGQVEAILTSSLYMTVPDGFSRRVMAESDSVELDANLAASAPVGFRERLMQRLRKTGESEE